jgi:DNA-binding SARP family transcriptional activator
VNALPNDEENDDLDGTLELTEDDESGLAYIKEMVDDCNSLEELIALYNTVSDEYSQLIELLYEDDSIGEKLKNYGTM